jgi:hypothetical protein
MGLRRILTVSGLMAVGVSAATRRVLGQRPARTEHEQTL